MKKLLLGIMKQNYSFSTKKYQLVKSLIATLFLFLSGLNFGLYAQNTLNNVGMTSVASSGGAYSLRKLSSAYTGNAILVRRSSDNTTQNIGFTPAGLLDETTLLAFVGSGNGFVQTWYDQSGFNRHVTQSTLASQPRIVNAGVIERQNGVPSVYFTGSSFLTHTSFPTTGFTGFTANIVARWTTTGTSQATIQTLLDNNHNATQGFDIQDRPDLSGRPLTFGIAANPSGAGVQDNFLSGNGTTRIFTFVANSTTVSGFKEGTALPTASISGTNYTLQNRFVIGAWFNGGTVSRFTTGHLGEVLVFPSALSIANRQALECNQSAYFSIPFVPSGVEFYIQNAAASSACSSADEQVVWKLSDLVNTQSSGNNLIKVNSNGNWDGGAASWNTLSNHGYFQFTASETNTERMVGLSSTNSNASFNSIQYAWYLRNNGTCEIYESGTSRGSFGSYGTTDVFKISVEANVIKYYQNNTLRYISTIAPNLPLLVDVSINNVNGTVSNAIVSNYATGSFTATAVNVASSPSYQWKLNGNNVGTNSTTYSTTALSDNDVVSCVLSYVGVCGSPTSLTSNSVTNKSVSSPTSIDFYIQGTVGTTACNTSDEEVRWKIAELTNTQITGTGNSLRKIQSNNWDGGASSWNTVGNNGYFQFTASETNSARMIGLSTSNVNSNYNTIQYAIYLRSDGQWEVFESGSSRGVYGAYVSNNIFKITVEANVVKYYQNGVLRYISTIAPSLPLLVDVSINSVGGTITNAIVSNYNNGVFTATATNAGISPIYQWKLNGINVGANSPTYTNTALSNNDVVTCTLLPDLPSCSNVTPYTSNAITNKSIGTDASIDFYITGGIASSSCSTVDEQVKWKISDLENVQATTNSLLKIQSNGNWNGGASSWNRVSDNGYFQFTGVETNTARMVGLSSSNVNSNYNTIQFAWYLRNDGICEIYESGSSRGTFGSYAANSIFKIAVKAGVVNYYLNGALVYSSAVVPSLPLLVDVSIHNVLGTVSNAIVSNLSNNTFTAFSSGAGPNPSYQWLLNGSNVGSNSSTYSNAFLTSGDVVSCLLTPDFGGCGTTNYASNAITTVQVGAPTSIEFVIQGTPANTGCNVAKEDVRWLTSSLLNLSTSDNSLIKIQSNGNWDGGAASRNIVSNNGSFEFTATETSTARMAGLSSVNTNANYNTIQFAWYLRNDGICEIYESGTTRGNFGAYTAGTVFKVSVEEMVVKYYLNNVLRYTSTIIPSMPMIADVSIHNIGGTITDAKITNYNAGVFTASSTNAGASPSYQWYVNGASVGTNSSTYTNSSLGGGDVVSCILTPDLSGCFNAQIESNVIVNQQVSNPVGIEFFIQGTAVNTGCIISSEYVVWKGSENSNLLATGNSLLKIQSNGNWNGGAASYNTVSNNGYLEFTASETNTARMAGLSATNINSNYNTIQYAWYMRNDGICEIYESGTTRGNFGAYSAGSVFKIAVEAGVVKYYLNGSLQYISAIAPALPLLVDVSIHNVNGTITNAIVSNFNSGTFTASSTNAGLNPTFQWKLNGMNVGSGGATYTNTNLTNNDIITCQLTPTISGCFGVSPVLSNAISNNFIGQTPIEFYIQANADIAACKTAEENIVWQTASLLNVSASGNSLQKIQSNGSWNGGASSWNTVKNNGFFQFTATETDKARMVGLSSTNTNANYNTIQYAWYLRNDGICEIFESGTSRGSFGAFSGSDRFKIAIESAIVKYYRNDVLTFTSAISPTLPLLVDVSINNVNGTVTNAFISNYYSGLFSALATNAGTSPSFQWKLNGLNVGTNSAVYSNSSIAPNDVVSCILTPSVTGCSASGNIASNAIVNKAIANLTGSDIVVRGTVATATCPNVVSEDVVWNTASLQNVSALGSSLLKTQSNGNWNGGAASYNAVGNNGYLEFTATETTAERMCGLSTSNVNSNFNTIQYAINLRNNGTCQVYESGSLRGSFGSYNAGDRFRVAVESNIVRYYRNGTLFYSSALTPSLPLLVDVSINNVNGTISNAKVVNTNAGTYTVTASNVGASPTYQWKVNGANVGTSSSTYVNTNLQINDVVSCVVTPDASGCDTATYQSNLVTVLSSGNPVVAPISGSTSVCLGDTTQLSNSTPGGVWSSSNAVVATINASGLVTTLAAGTATMTYTVTSGSCSSNAVVMITVNNFTPTVTLSTSSSNICLGSSATFNATALQTGGGAISYSFKINGVSVQSGFSSTFTTTSLLQGDIVTCQISISGGTCLAQTTATSNSIAMVVNAVSTPSVVLSTPSTTNCSGSSATFTATSSNTGGGVISYNFRVNGVSVQNGTINSYVLTNPANGVVVGCDISVLGGTCLSSTTATSNSIVLSIGANSTPTVSITSSATTFCVGNSATITATAMNTGGGTVTYTFLNNGAIMQSGASNVYSSSTIANGSAIKCNITVSGGSCLTSTVAGSNTLNFNVTSPTIVLTSSGTTLCTGANVVFTATASNTSGVGSITYIFQRNGVTVQSGSSSTYSTSTYANGDVFDCVLSVSGGVCSNVVSVTSNPISINALNTTVSITPSANTICSGTSVTFTATANNTGGGTITYTFRRNSVIVQTGSSNIYTTSSISNGTSFSCSISVTGSSCGNPTASSNAVVMNVITTVTPSVALALSPISGICAGSAVTFTATPTNGGVSPTYNFRVNGVSVQNTNSNTYVTSTLSNGQTVDVVMTSTALCTTTSSATSNVITVAILPTPTVGPASATPSVNVNASITPITHLTTGATGIAPASGLPAGVIATWSSNTITIAGTPTVSGVFNYSISLLSVCGSATATGTITVKSDIDGDGVDYALDGDDDNDGITDVLECGLCSNASFMNGNFETPVIATSSSSMVPLANMSGWMNSVESSFEVWSTGFNGVPAATGNQFVKLNAGTIYQTFCLNGAGGTINWSVKHRGRAGIDVAAVRVGAAIGSVSTIATLSDGISAWGAYAGTYVIPTGQTSLVIAFSPISSTGGVNFGNFIDDIQITINQSCKDSDGDGVTDNLDLDSDNDGIPDIEEAGFKQYSNNTATMDISNAANWTDSNTNGISDSIDTMISASTYMIVDSDGDGIPNYLDLDSDNDSFWDVDEAGLLNGDGDVNGDGKGDGVDTDSDGILDLFDNTTVFGTNFRVYAQDTDANSISDYLQLDSNSDGIKDIQTGLYASFDANGDGKVDGSGDADSDGILDVLDTDDAVKGSPRDLNRKLYLDFDGRNDYAENISVLGGLSNATLMAWVDLNSNFSTTGVVVGQDKFQVRVTSSRTLQVLVNGSTLTYSTALNKSQWYHLAATYGGGTLALYLNGKLVASQAVGGGIASDTSKLTIGKNPLSSTDYFKGKIDEVRVFNTALTALQVQRMVYQEIQNSSTQVRGSIVPKDVGSLPFANVIRYYRMDTYKDDIVDDLTTSTIDVGSGMKMYNHKVIAVQEAPMPFTTLRTGTFATAVDDPTKDIRGLDVFDSDFAIIQVKHDITETANSTDLGLFIDPGLTVNMTNDTKLQNDWYLKLDGKIDLVGKSQLVQTAQSELDATSAGSLERDQQGQSNKFNYNYWSSPVSSINNSTINHGFTVAGVMKDGTTNLPQNLSWTTGVNSSPTVPLTLSSYWIYKFQNSTNSYANWSPVGQNGTLLAGQGYTLKGSGSSTLNQNYTFVGKPNSGTITSIVGPGNLNLCGNPYASAIDADKFIDDNASSLIGTLYFWEHYPTNSSHYTIQYQGGYGTYTKTGGTPPVAPSGISGLGSSSKVAKRFIPVGQGFFVTGSTSGGTITFNNAQRLFIKEDDTVNSFTLFKTINRASADNVDPLMNNAQDDFEQQQFMKIRLGFNATDNLHRQILLGFMNEHATSGYDNGYDGISIETLSNDMYFINGTEKLNISGEGFFNVNAIYPLGVKNATSGLVTFVVDNKENFDEGQDIFIYDNESDTYNSIKSQAYQVYLPSGTYDSRFSLRFTDGSSLGVGENEGLYGVSITHAQTSNVITIKNVLQEVIVKSVSMYNLLGQQITEWQLDDQDQSNIKLQVGNVATGTYIIKVITDGGIITKKILAK
ncbi:LamG-like jellyroll fold domain-containing protein [Flavobacterium phycosphaerae]|uniref:LamG-like jellyroll fold domain-containing protein n=1 Tax=Flavobacterium phycosphaerae TaxID=2697515 RepID=UPI00138961C4|nr:LamG-like jellyroll fold domain-containing protein [Flavobacterium phycosphaerae]